MSEPDFTVDDFLNAFIRQAVMLFPEGDMARKCTVTDGVMMLQTLTIMVRGLMEASNRRLEP